MSDFLSEVNKTNSLLQEDFERRGFVEAKEMTKGISTEEMYKKLMGHFTRNRPGRHSGHAGEYFQALKKIKIKKISDREEKMIKELWSMYGSKLESKEMIEGKFNDLMSEEFNVLYNDMKKIGSKHQDVEALLAIFRLTIKFIGKQNSTQAIASAKDFLDKVKSFEIK